MEEQSKKERSSVEIQSEYQNLCAKAGHIQYTVGVMNSDLERINGALRDLNNEHHAAKAKEQAKAEESKEEAKS